MDVLCYVEKRKSTTLDAAAFQDTGYKITFTGGAHNQ